MAQSDGLFIATRGCGAGLVETRRTLLAKGIKAAGLGIVWFLTICCYAFRGPQSVVDSPRQIKVSRSVSTPKIHLNLNLFSRHEKTRKTAPKASRKQQKSIPKFIKNDFFEKWIVPIRSLRKPRIWESQASKIRHRDRYKVT